MDTTSHISEFVTEIQHPNPPDGFYSHDNTTMCDVEMNFDEIAYKIEKFINTIGICVIKTGNDTVYGKPIIMFNIDVFFRYNRIKSTVYITTGRTKNTVHYYLKSGDRYTGTKLFYVMINKSGISTLQIPRLLMSHPIDKSIDIPVKNIANLSKNIIDMLSQPFSDQVYCGVSHIMSSYYHAPDISYVPYIHTIVNVLDRFSSDPNIMPVTAVLLSKIFPYAIEKHVVGANSDLRRAITYLITCAKKNDTDPICARVCLDSLCTLIYKIPTVAEMIDIHDVIDAVFFSGPFAHSHYLTGVAARLAAQLDYSTISQKYGMLECSCMWKVLTDERIRLEDQINCNNGDMGEMQHSLMCVAKLELYITDMIIENRENTAREPCVKLSRHACELRDMIETLLKV